MHEGVAREETRIAVLQMYGDEEAHLYMRKISRSIRGRESRT